MAIPRFHMVCPPFREPMGRTVTPLHIYSFRSLGTGCVINELQCLLQPEGCSTNHHGNAEEAAFRDLK